MEQKTKQVLFVDDEADWRHVPEINWLKHTLNCKVIVATDVASALEKVEDATWPFDLIVLDVILPDPEALLNESLLESGLRFLRKLKERNQKIPPVIVYSALNKHVSKDIREQFKEEEEGATWLPKGSTENFKEVVKKFLAM